MIEIPLMNGTESMAGRTRHQWLMKHPGSSLSATGMVQPDDSLTSLNWLHNLNIMTINTPTPPASPQPFLGLAGYEQRSTPASTTAVLQLQLLTSDQATCCCAEHPPDGECVAHHHHQGAGATSAAAAAQERVDYKSNPFVKPPYSYATLICMAMKETRRNKITLSGIYTWITENFLYYRNADPSWQNSIRHNLSLNKCFQKVARRKDEPGKGGFWKINPEYSDMFVNGIFKKRRGGHNVMSSSSPASSSSSSSNTTMAACDHVSMSSDISDDLCVHHSTIDTSVLRQDGATAPMPKRLKLEEDEAALASKALSVQMRGDSIFSMGADSISDVLDISWNAAACFEQTVVDITGLKVKSEPNIDEAQETIISTDSLMPMSPPLSDNSSEDVASFEDLLGVPLDFSEESLVGDGSGGAAYSTVDCVDLTVQGTGIRPPTDWWSSQHGVHGTGASFVDPAMLGFLSSRDLNTPTPSGQITDIVEQSIATLNSDHPWAEDRLELDQALASFGPSDIFDLENIDPLQPVIVGEHSWRNGRA